MPGDKVLSSNSFLLFFNLPLEMDVMDNILISSIPDGIP